MTKEELFLSHQYVVKVAIIQHFGNTTIANRLSKAHGIELDDLYQIGYTELWSAINNDSFEGENIYGYGLVAVKRAIMEFFTRKGSIIRFPYKDQRELKTSVSIGSMDKQDGEQHTLHDYLPSNTNVENYVMRKLEFEDKLSRLKPFDRRIIMLKLNGLKDKEVASVLRSKATAIQTRRRRAIEKMLG